MATPVFALRLSKQVQSDLAIMAQMYGAPNPRAFAREVLEVMTSGDFEKVKAFNARLCAGMGEQMTLKLNALVEPSKPAQKPVKKAKKKDKGKKGGGRARSTS